VKKMDIKPEHYFWLKNGGSIKSIDELPDALDVMPNEIFSHHVNDHKNDFSRWVNDVFDNKELAEMMLAAKSMNEMKQKVRNYISDKTKKQEKLEMPKLLAYIPEKTKIKVTKEKIVSKIKRKVNEVHAVIKTRANKKKSLAKKSKKVAKPKIKSHKAVAEKTASVDYIMGKKNIDIENKKEVELPSIEKKCEMRCRFHTFEGPIAEFILGVAVGVTIAIALSVFL